MILYESEYYGVQAVGDTVTHWGLKGMHWGQRRFQNEDGSLTPAGRERYGVGSGRYPHGSGDAGKKSGKQLKKVDHDYEYRLDKQLRRIMAVDAEGGDLTSKESALVKAYTDNWGEDTIRKALKDVEREMDLEEKGHNPDGSLRDRPLNNFVKTCLMDSKKYPIDFDALGDSEKKEAYLKASNNLQKLEREHEKLMKDFYNNKDLSEKYITDHAKKQWDALGEGTRGSWGSFEDFKNWHLYDDGDQGEAFENYMSEKQSKHMKAYEKAHRANDKASKEYAKELVGKNGDKTITYKSKSGPTYTYDSKTHQYIKIRR